MPTSRATVVALVSLALVLPACTTQQLQKQYASFDACFKDQKILATAGGALVGAVLGRAIGGSGNKGVAIGVAGAVLGGIIGNRVAWESCLKAFPPRAQTTLITPVSMPTPGAGVPVASRSLKIQNVVAQPLVFGRDLEVSANYFLVSDRPGAADIKARVHRNLLFTGPDGAQQEIASSTEDIVQQGTSRSSFALPTPSPQEAPELAQTRDWKFKLVVEAEGMRQEQVIPLSIVSSEAAAQQARATLTSTMPAPAAAQPPTESIDVRAGSVLTTYPGSTQATHRVRSNTAAKVLQKVTAAGFHWTEVELPSGTKGWLRGARQ